ncbi:unnamed protein product [Cyprideis torosa]|uniref:Netrin receptor UNC5A-D-like N-terminal domain-containing protein n=1 Tax=Cyprideis torosa TaxID=163714 RepID=A0A7R8W9Z5_9CRUS|nr:unnamed protein product [Cyprideis torosa]CAG0890328.1 unnamed protein product [Cyprideis torosa]
MTDCKAVLQQAERQFLTQATPGVAVAAERRPPTVVGTGSKRLRFQIWITASRYHWFYYFFNCSRFAAAVDTQLNCLFRAALAPPGDNLASGKDPHQEGRPPPAPCSTAHSKQESPLQVLSRSAFALLSSSTPPRPSLLVCQARESSVQTRWQRPCFDSRSPVYCASSVHSLTLMSVMEQVMIMMTLVLISAAKEPSPLDILLPTDKNSPPVFLEEPADSFVFRNRPAELRCRAAHAVRLYFRCSGDWGANQQKEATYVEPSNGIRHTEAELFITKADVPTDGLVCHCVAWSTLGQTSTKKAKVVIA